MTNIQGRFVASHNGSGHWTVLDGENNELLFNVVPVGFTGDLGQLTDLPTFTTADVRDMIRVLTSAVDGIAMGGWGNNDDQTKGRPVAELVVEARGILESFKWAEQFPNGRSIFYEGEDPNGFAETIREEFGLDVTADEDAWVSSCGFHCPTEHLDAIYGSGRFPIGS